VRKPILSLDFDGVIHSYSSGWQGAGACNDPPVEGTTAFLVEATKHFRVMVHSSRSKSLSGRRAMKRYVRKYFAVPLTFSSDHEVDFLHEAIEFPWFKPSASVTIDDRALTFTGDWRDFSPAALLNFKPWNKRPGHYLRERYGLDEKPDGWNESVLHHFYTGPELRQPTPAFRGAFIERATELEQAKAMRHELNTNDATQESQEQPLADPPDAA